MLSADVVRGSSPHGPQSGMSEWQEAALVKPRTLCRKSGAKHGNSEKSAYDTGTPYQMPCHY